jgi:hypothetical protein
VETDRDFVDASWDSPAKPAASRRSSAQAGTASDGKEWLAEDFDGAA